MSEKSSLKNFLMPECIPSIHDTAFIAPGAVVLGAVTVGENASVWYGCVMRGDINRIALGPSSNLQDGCIVHVSDAYAAIIGERVSVGHRAVIHACDVGDEVLVGMGAIIMDGAVIGPRSIIGAGAIVTKGTQVPEGSLVLGSPGRVVRTLTHAEQQDNARLAAKYVEVSRRFREMYPAPGGS
ncbi:gamma carbonic anhydrase family protein [Roseimicrobium gellanilyticum]